MGFKRQNDERSAGFRKQPTHPEFNSSYFGAAMGLGKVQRWSDGNDAGRVDLLVSHVVMAFDVIEIHRFGDAWLLIEIHQVAPKIFVIHNPPHVALEMSVIHGVEADECAEEPPIRLDDTGSKKEPARGEARLQFIQRNK